MPVKAWWENDKEKAKDLKEALENNFTNKQIYELIKITPNQLLTYKHKFLSKNIKTLTYQELTQQIVDVKEKLDSLLKLKEELSLNFQYKDGQILIHGINEEEPICASPQNWIRFLSLGGAGKLRDFCSKYIK